MPFELSIRVQLAAIPTEDDAVDLANRVQEVITNALLTTPGVPTGDLVVSNHGVIEYDESTGALISATAPAELSPEEGTP